MRKEERREALAALTHQQRAEVIRRLLGKCHATRDGGMLIPAALAARCMKHMNTPYAHLEERDKEGDRQAADKILALLE